MILKTSNKSLWSRVFWYVKVCIFWKCIQYIIHCEKTQILKKISFGQNKRYKICPLFSFASSNHHNFTFNMRFLYELKHKVHLSKTVCGIFHFRFRFVYIKVYFFVQQNAWTLWLKKVIIPFKIKITEKPHTVLLADLWFLSCNKKF